MNSKSTIDQIRYKLYQTFVFFGADSLMLGYIGSWGESFNDEEFLVLITTWLDDQVTENLTDITEGMQWDREKIIKIANTYFYKDDTKIPEDSDSPE